MQTRINREKYTLRYKIIGAPRKKNGPVLYLGLKINHTGHQKPNPTRETVPLKLKMH